MTTITKHKLVSELIAYSIMLTIGCFMILIPTQNHITNLITNIGWIFIYGTLVLSGITVFQLITSCKLCILDLKHTLPQCIHERLLTKGDSKQ